MLQRAATIIHEIYLIIQLPSNTFRGAIYASYQCVALCFRPIANYELMFNVDQRRSEGSKLSESAHMRPAGHGTHGLIVAPCQTLLATSYDVM